ncbi:MAG: RNA polymerase sigma factor [Elusimicrobiota bacterium]
MPEPLDADADLVRRCLAGDGDGFARILERYNAPVYSFLLRFVGDAADAEDLAQETFLKAFRSLESYDQSRPLRSWLFAIAHHAALDFLRARKPAALSLDHEDDPIDPADAADGPEKLAEIALDGALVEKLIAALPPLYREVLLLRHLQDLSVAEVAAALAVPEGTVKIRLFRAREMMRQKWETFENNETGEVPHP